MDDVLLAFSFHQIPPSEVLTTPQCHPPQACSLHLFPPTRSSTADRELVAKVRAKVNPNLR